MIKKGIKSGEKADRERVKGWRGLVRPGDLKNREASGINGTERSSQLW